MVVDDLHDLGLLEAVDGLGALVVVDEDDVLLVGVDQVGRAHDAGVGAVLVDDGEEAVLRAGHDLLRVVDGGVDGEAVDLVGGEHLGAHGDGHGDEAGGGVGVVRGGDDGAAALLGGRAHDARDLGAVADDEAAHAAVDCVALRLVAVGDKHDVALLDGLLHHLGRGAHEHLAALDDGRWGRRRPSRPGASRRRWSRRSATRRAPRCRRCPCWRSRCP